MTDDVRRRARNTALILSTAGQQRAADVVTELLAEADRLQHWKDEALPVIFGLQDLGRALRIPLGQSITGPMAVERARELLVERDTLLGALKELHQAADCADNIDEDFYRSIGETIATFDR